MRVVTGSTGLLGNNLVRTLLQAGYEVWALACHKVARPGGSSRQLRSSREPPGEFTPFLMPLCIVASHKLTINQ